MTQIPFTKLHDQYIESKADVDSAIQKILDTTEFIAGPTVAKFEQAWTNATASPSCAAVGSGTFALVLSLMACGVTTGHEVITTPHTFIATAEAIKLVGATPIFVDIDEYYHIDATQIESHITDKTKAILFVDLYGQCADITSINRIAKKHNLYVIEDAAQSAGATYNKQPVGNLVDLTCFSFNPVKNLGAIGDAGAVTGRKDLIDKVKMYRDHGRSSRFEYDTIGYNARMDCLQAAVLLEKIKYYQGWQKQKLFIANQYRGFLSDYVVTPKTRPENTHSYYVYVIQVPNRNQYIKHMANKGIETKIHYKKPINVYESYFPYQQCVQAEKVCDSIISLPCYHTLKRQEQDLIIEETQKWSIQHS